MKDTPPAIERKFRQMLLARSGTERLKMGCSMHATARALAKAALLQKHPGARPAELKRLLFLHFYGTDLTPEGRRKILRALRKAAKGCGKRINSHTQAVHEEQAVYRGKKNRAKPSQR